MVKWCFELELYSPEDSNTQPLKFSHLSRQKCSKGFHHQSPHWSLCIHAKTNRKKNMTVGSKLSTNDASRLEVWVRPSVKCQTGSFQGTLVGRTKWKPSFMWGKGRGRLVCTLQFANGSAFLSNVIQDSLATLRPETEVVAYILAGWLFMYLPWIFTQARCVPKPPTKPDGTRLSNRKKHQTLKILLFLSYEYTICCAKLYLWI